jgi:renalase
MATNSFRTGDRDTPALARADLGAQYITTRSTTAHPELGPIYRRLLDQGVLVPFHGEVAGPNPYGDAGDEVKHFVAPSGLQSVAADFLGRSQVPVEFFSVLEELSVDEGGNVRLGIQSGGTSTATVASPEERHVVVLTQPVQQLLGGGRFPVKGNYLERTEPAIADALGKVEYSSRFAMAYYFGGTGDAFQWPFPWTVRYFQGGDVRYVAYDSAKRDAGARGETASSIVVHSGVPFGIEFLDLEEPFKAAEERLLRDLEKKMPEVPWAKATHVKCHKWRYSQVYKGLGGARPNAAWAWPPEALASEAAPGCVPLFRTPNSLALVCGDAMAPASNFEGCVFSAYRCAAAIREFVAAEATAKVDL